MILYNSQKILYNFQKILYNFKNSIYNFIYFYIISKLVS